MSEVKRYDISAFGGMSMDECSDGVYVNYEDYAALESKCSALATENAGLKSAVTQQIKLRAEIKNAGRPPHADFWVQSIYEAEEKVKLALEETPATDAFLAEIRAQGVEMFAQWCRCERDFTLIDEDVADAAAYEECVKRAEYFSAQLRKGGEQK